MEARVADEANGDLLAATQVLAYNVEATLSAAVRGGSRDKPRNLYHAPMAAETHTRQRWIRLGLESAAVLASILTAFAIDAGWDHRTAVRDEQAALTRLLDEFDANRAELEAVREGHQRLHDDGVQLLRVAYGLAAPSAESPEQLRRVLGMSIYFDPSMGALGRFLASDETGNVAGRR